MSIILISFCLVQLNAFTKCFIKAITKYNTNKNFKKMKTMRKNIGKCDMIFLGNKVPP